MNEEFSRCQSGEIGPSNDIDIVIIRFLHILLFGCSAYGFANCYLIVQSNACDFLHLQLMQFSSDETWTKKIANVTCLENIAVREVMGCCR